MNQSQHTVPAPGFSIVELMVALAISGFLVLGVTSMFLSTRQSYQVQDAMSELQETGRLAVDRIARDVRMTGYRDSNWTLGAIPNALTADDGASDSVTISYEAARDCNRVPAPPGGIVTNLFDVAGGALRCNGTPLFRGVEELQVLFGDDLDGDGVANRLVPPTAAGLDMTRVVTVNVNLLVSAADDQVATGAAPLTPGLWTSDPGDDGRIRREFSMTIALRNPL